MRNAGSGIPPQIIKVLKWSINSTKKPISKKTEINKDITIENSNPILKSTAKNSRAKKSSKIEIEIDIDQQDNNNDIKTNAEIKNEPKKEVKRGKNKLV